MTKTVVNAWRALVLRKGLKPEVIQPPVGDLGLEQLAKIDRDKICTGFGVPLGLVEAGTVNRATAEVHRVSFYTETVIPESQWIEDDLNYQLFGPLGLRFEFKVQEIEAVQKDEAVKADAYSGLIEQLLGAVDRLVLMPDETRMILNSLLGQMALPTLEEGRELPTPAVVAEPTPAEQEEEPKKAVPLEWGAHRVYSQN